MTEFDKYFTALQTHSIADITEHSHRSNLQQLLESLAGTKVKILHEPKREGKFGSPDFKVTSAVSDANLFSRERKWKQMIMKNTLNFLSFLRNRHPTIIFPSGYL